MEIYFPLKRGKHIREAIASSHLIYMAVLAASSASIQYFRKLMEYEMELHNSKQQHAKKADLKTP
jgi:hypothetical protein